MCRSRTIWTGKDRVKFLLYEPSRKEPARIAGFAWNARPRLMEREKGAELRQLVVERRIEQIYLHVEPCSSTDDLTLPFSFPLCEKELFTACPIHS